MESDNIYTIKKGDNFWSLENNSDIPYGTLQKLNPTLNPNKIQIGQKIKMPTIIYLVVEKPTYPLYIHENRFVKQPIDNLRVEIADRFARDIGNTSTNFHYIDPFYLNNLHSTYNRLFGGVQMIGGALETIIGGVGGILSAETGVGLAIGYVVFANGIDNTVTGFEQLWTGESTETYLHAGVRKSSGMLGADCNTAEKIATTAELSTLLFGGIKSYKVNSSKNVKLMFKNTKGTKQIGLRATNTNNHFRLERHRYKGKMDTHFNYGKNGAGHWPKRGRN